MEGFRYKSVVVTAGIVVLAQLGWVSLTHGWADLLALQGRVTLLAWDTGAQRLKLNEADWQQAQSRLERALALTPGDAGLTEDLGRLHEIRTQRLPATSPAVPAELKLALDYLRRSLRVRPTSPYTWANIAIVKSRQGALDAEFQQAIARAALLGPWEPDVQLALADIGFRNWKQLPATTRATIQANLQRGLKHRADRLFDLARRTGGLNVLCATPGVARSKRALACL